MDSRRLVVWISTGILVFQGSTLAFDLLNCSAMAWLLLLRQGGANAAALHHYAQFCSRPQDRLDRAVSQGLSVLAGLALGRSANGRSMDGS
jgi:hypothetical protein